MDTPPPISSPPPLSSSPNSEDRIWIIVCHLSFFIGLPLLLPLIIYLVKKTDSPAVADQAKEALNFHISCFIYAMLCLPLMLVLIGIVMLMALGAAAAVLSIIAAVKSSEGVLYRYPMTIRLVK